MKSYKEKILSKISSFEEGKIFTIDDIRIEGTSDKVYYYPLKQLLSENKIEKLARGKYFIPKNTKYGNLKPKDNDIIKFVIDTIYKKTKSKPYFASNTIFQKLGLTTQISSEIFIVCNIPNNTHIEFKNLKFNLIKFKSKWNKNQIKQLEFLYALQNIHSIPDATIDDSYDTLFAYLKTFTVNEIIRLIETSDYFSPRTKALFGTMLEKMNHKIAMQLLKNKISDTTTFRHYKFKNSTISKEIKKHWRLYDIT